MTKSSFVFTFLKSLLRIPFLPTISAKRGDVHTIHLPAVAMEPIQTAAHQQLWLPLQGNQKGEIISRRANSCFNSNTFEREATNRKEIMKTPVKNIELGLRLISSPPAGESLLHLPPMWETGFQKQFSTGTHPSHP